MEIEQEKRYDIGHSPHHSLALMYPKIFLGFTLTLSVVSATGDYTVLSVVGQAHLDGAPLRPKQKIETGTITTRQKSRVRILASQKGIIDIGPDSNFTLAERKTTNTHRLDFGVVRAVIKKRKRIKKPIKIKTQWSVISVRGTELSIKANAKEDKLQVSVLSGEVDVEDEAKRHLLTTKKQYNANYPFHPQNQPSITSLTDSQIEKIRCESRFPQSVIPSYPPTANGSALDSLSDPVAQTSRDFRSVEATSLEENKSGTSESEQEGEPDTLELEDIISTPGIEDNLDGVPGTDISEFNTADVNSVVELTVSFDDL